ncbi:hypothetical protein [Maridesulfovibrio sp.]|uniref:hypothetical protein n=1 Tax=Maridesulfovibrio sp. TaxID=2795000 RepID=UPI002AA7B138|nr:hypothetical protein [Maridesulfovibrio sp.]
MRIFILIFYIFVISSCSPGYLEIQKKTYAQLDNFSRKEDLTNFAVIGAKRSDVIDKLGEPDVKKEFSDGRSIAVYHRKVTFSEKYAKSFSQESYLIYYNRDDVIDNKIILKDDEFDTWEKINIKELRSSNLMENVTNSFRGILTLDLVSLEVTKENLRNGKAILEPIYVFNGRELTPNWDLTKKIHSKLSQHFNLCSFDETRKYHHFFLKKLNKLEKLKEVNMDFNEKQFEGLKKRLSSTHPYTADIYQLTKRMEEQNTHYAKYFSGEYNIYDVDFYNDVILKLNNTVNYVISPNCSQFEFYTVVLKSYSKGFQNIKRVNVESAYADESKIAFYDIETIKKMTSKGFNNPMFAMSSFFNKSRHHKLLTQLTKDNVSFLINSLQKLNVTTGIKSTTLE